jgi:transaldolase
MNRLIKSKLLVDTGDPNEARMAQDILKKAGYDGLDGATTNPSYFAKNPDVQVRIKKGEKFTREELFGAYKKTVQELSEIIPGGDISVEVYADKKTEVNDIVGQAREMNSWIPTARIKLPIIESGLLAAEVLKDEMRLNMTLCFSQQQAAAVYAITKNPKESIVISPFIGRLDDIGVNGAQFVGNVVKMFKESDGHVEVLAASFRRLDNILEMIRVGTDIITINLGRFESWQEEGFVLPDENFVYEFDGKDVPFENIKLDKDWREYDIHNELTDIGLQKFVDDWNALLI